MNETIPLSVPNLGVEETEAVIRALDGGWISSAGPDVNKFEDLFSKFIGVNHSVACSSGTSALHTALLAGQVGKDDEVFIPNITFVATANAVSYVGARQILIDICPETLGLSPKSVQNFIDKSTVFDGSQLVNKESGNPIKAMIPVHMLGTPADIVSLRGICNKYNLYLLEDAAEALGSSLHGSKCGTLGDIACFSFNGNKIITSGGGGMITTHSQHLAKRAQHLSTTAKTDSERFFHDEVGYNYRLVNILAAIGVAQLKKVDQFISIKRKTQQRYLSGLQGNPSAKIFSAPKGYASNYWLNLVTFHEDLLLDRGIDQLMAYFNSLGIQTRPLWTRLDELPMFANCARSDLSCSKFIHQSSLLIPSCTGITDDQIDRVIMAINDLS